MVISKYSKIPCYLVFYVHGTARRKQGSKGFWRIKKGYQRKNQGLDGKTVKRETIRKRRRIEDTIDSKTAASFIIIILETQSDVIRENKIH